MNSSVLSAPEAYVPLDPLVLWAMDILISALVISILSTNFHRSAPGIGLCRLAPLLWHRAPLTQLWIRLLALSLL